MAFDIQVSTTSGLQNVGSIRAARVVKSLFVNSASGTLDIGRYMDSNTIIHIVAQYAGVIKTAPSLTYSSSTGKMTWEQRGNSPSSLVFFLIRFV